MQFYSQCYQDRFLLDNFFRGRRGGVFVDIGAYDGEKFSNTLFFEKSMGWTGLCVEPLPSAFQALKARRKAICENVAVADFEGDAEFLEAEVAIDERMLSGLTSQFDPRHLARLRQATSKRVLRVPVTRLSTLLAKHGLFRVDYCSVDTEGAELAVLSDFDPARFDISLFTIENNYGDPRIPELMANKGYDLVTSLEQDQIYKRRGIEPLPQTSVICAVWHGDPDRFERLRGHAANLARQTVPVEPIYVFDGGDRAPDWLEARVLSVKEDLTIYQAWNVALSLVSTPLVMNLNLDDRLAPDAVALLEREINKQQAVAAGGEWKLCYSQAETDAVEACYPGGNLPFVQAWPPPRGTRTRLGSGSGERGTFGPATMWRMAAHLGAPRYPWRLQEGTLLKANADLAWWHLLQSHPRFKVVRLPIVIGHYFCHPGEQAEFRFADERGLLIDPGLSLL